MASEFPIAPAQSREAPMQFPNDITPDEWALILAVVAVPALAMLTAAAIW